jgi:FkbM family methyltransferase
VKAAPPDPPEVAGLLWDGVTGDTAWDVGANCGQTLPILAARFKQVVAFEPAHECLPMLWPVAIAAAEQHFATIVVKPIAVSDHDGDITLLAMPGKIDTGQLVSQATAVDWTHPDSPDTQLRTVPARSLDSLSSELPPPDFIKVDVEGHEDKVLDGACGLIADHQPSWLIEFHSPDLHAFCRDLLIRYGYHVATIRHPHYYPGTPMWFAHGWLSADWYP